MVQIFHIFFCKSYWRNLAHKFARKVRFETADINFPLEMMTALCDARGEMFLLPSHGCMGKPLFIHNQRALSPLPLVKMFG